MKCILLIMTIFLGAEVFAQEKETVEKFAEFPGGTTKFFEYIKKELRYPADALKDSITGDVHVTFIVNARGVIDPESIKIEKGLSPSCDQEALRIIRKAPAWTPGRVKAKGATSAVAAEQQITFPVSFRFKD